MIIIIIIVTINILARDTQYNNIRIIAVALRLDDNNNLAQSSILLLMCALLITIGYWVII